MRAVGSKVIVQKAAVEEKHASGLYMPATAKESNVVMGKVVSVAKSYIDNGFPVALPFYEGETVGFFMKNAIKIDGSDNLYFMDVTNVIYVQD
jgi:co-chaperonin GroES (HSP10)